MARARAAALAATGLVAVVALSLFARTWVPSHNWLFSGHYALGFEDLLSRYRDIWRVRHGYNLYSTHNHRQYFTYPPAALFLFWPLRWLAFRTDVLDWTLLSLLALAWAGYLAWRQVRPAAERLVVAGGALWASALAVVVLPVISLEVAYGQLGLFILAALATDELGRKVPGKGVLTGIAAAIKVYPGVFILSWLWRREWNKALTAIASAAATTLAAYVVWPRFSDTFVRRQLFSGWEIHHFLLSKYWHAVSSSPYTIFFRWPFHGGTYAAGAGWAASLLVVALGLFAGARLAQVGARVGALCVTMAGAIFFGPVTWDHYYTFAPLMVVVAIESWDRRALRWASLLALLVYAVPWQLARNEAFSPEGLSARTLVVFVARNAYLAASVAVMLAALWSTRRARSAGDRLEQAAAPLAQ